MTNKPEQESNPHKESNDDKGNQASYKHVKPEKKPNAEPENPLREQKQLFHMDEALTWFRAF